jgi:hypothetical protein
MGRWHAGGGIAYMLGHHMAQKVLGGCWRRS